MAKRDELLDALDHPIFFSLVLALVVAGWLSIFTFLAKKADLPGAASFAQHP